MLNPDRFLLDFRDIEIVKYVRQRVNPICGEIVAKILKEYPRTRSALPVPYLWHL